MDTDTSFCAYILIHGTAFQHTCIDSEPYRDMEDAWSWEGGGGETLAERLRVACPRDLRQGNRRENHD